MGSNIAISLCSYLSNMLVIVISCFVKRHNKATVSICHVKHKNRVTVILCHVNH